MKEYLRDPYCQLAQTKVRIYNNDSDPVRGRLANYAYRLHGLRTYQLENGKIAFGGGRVDRDQGIGTLMVFGQEGDSPSTTLGKAQLFLRDMAAEDASYNAKARDANQAAATGKIPPMPPTSHWENLGDDGALMAHSLEAMPPLDDVSRTLIGQRTLHSLRYKILGGNRWLLSVHNSLMNMGPAGVQLARLFERRNNLVDMLLAKSNVVLQKSVNTLRAADRKSTNRRKGELVEEGYQKYVEKGILKYDTKDSAGNVIHVDNTPYKAIMEQVYQEIDKVGKAHHAQAKALGLDVKELLKPNYVAGHTGRHFPHRFDMSQFNDKGVTEDMIVSAMERFGLRNRDEAIGLLEKQMYKGRSPSERALDIAAITRQLMSNKPEEFGDNYTYALKTVTNFLNKSSDRLAGSLERDRLGLDGYITNMQRAYLATWTRNAYRIADTKVLGKSDAHVHQLIAQLEAEAGGGAQAAGHIDFATKVYHLEIGQKDSGLHRNPLLRELYLWEGAKLSLGFLGNSSQPLNTYIRVGMIPMVRAALRLAARVRREGRAAFSNIAEETGALPVSFPDDPHSILGLIGDIGSHVRANGMQGLIDPSEIQKGALGVGQRLARTVVGGSMWVFRGIESFNRSLSVLAGEEYFNQIAHSLAKQGRKGLDHRNIKYRLAELDLRPEAVLRAVENGDTTMLAGMRSKSGLRISDATQFKSGIQNMPLWRNEHPLGQFVYQYKTFGIGQAEFIMKELDPKMFARDPQRAIRAWSTVLTAFPAIGMAVTIGRSKIMGESLSADSINESLEDPDFANIVSAGVVGMSSIGALGIFADVIMTALMGNELSLKNFMVPPAGSSVINALRMSSSAFKAMVHGDPEELLHGTRAGTRELGGLGGWLQNRIIEPTYFPNADKAKSGKIPAGRI